MTSACDLMLLCLDLGTSAAKAALIDLTGRTVATASHPYPTFTTVEGGAEQDPADWLAAVRRTVSEILGSTSCAPVAVAVTGQMQDLVLLPAHGRPQQRAILYSDARAENDALEIREGLAAQGVDWDRLAGNLQDATSCAAMYRRLCRERPDTPAQTRGMVFGPAGYLADALGLSTWCDPTTASTTGLLDITEHHWSTPVAAAAGMDIARLPRLTTAPAQVIGRARRDAEAVAALPAGLPVVLVSGDAGATTAGVVGLRPGEAYAYLGTSGWVASVVADASTPGAEAPAVSHRLLLDASGTADTDADPSGIPERTDGEDSTEVTHRTAGRSLRISALLAAGAAAQWGRDVFLGGAAPGEADALLEAREAEHGRGPTGLLALPSIHGERFPVRDPGLRAAVLGMDADTRGIDLYAAVLEGVAQAIAHALEENAAASEENAAGCQAGVRRSAPGQIAVAGGGAASAPWRRILADVTGRDVLTVPETDATLRGAALLAADALHLDHDIRPLVEDAGLSGWTTAPDPSAAAEHAARRRAHRPLYEAAAQIQDLAAPSPRVTP